MYKEWVQVRYELDNVNKEINTNQKALGQKYKSKGDPAPELAVKANLEKQKAHLIEVEKSKHAAMMTKVQGIGNIVHDSVPVSMDEENNEVIRKWQPDDGPATETKTNLLSHHEVLLRLNGYDPERGVKLSGHRGYFLRDNGVYLNQAVINYALAFLRKRGFTALQTPQMINKDVMAKTAQLEDFDEELYKVVDGADEKYLIATSEQPISAYHSDEVFQHPSEELPLRYAGFSTCYRREAGSHGKDAWGIFRVHAFEKVEQFLITEPEKSWEAHEEMINTAEEFYKSLKLPYRVITIVSGALNNAAAKKYDLEAWFPFQNEYKELVSASNCTDYQSRRLNIRCGNKKMGEREKRFVHCLNATLCATQRAICCILENYQTENGPDGKAGVWIPEVLRPYMAGEEFMEYQKELPKDSTSKKRNAAAK